MTPEERAAIENGIWLCATHSVLIDRDEATYTVEVLRAMRAAHEAAMALEQARGTRLDFGDDLLALGPHVVCTGDVVHFEATSWVVRLTHFVIGDFNQLLRLVDDFDRLKPSERYVLSERIGDGRVLLAAPKLSRSAAGYELICRVAPSVSREDARRMGSDIKLSPDTDMSLTATGSIARVSGVEAFEQFVFNCLSVQRGEMPFAPTYGVRFLEYVRTYADTPWLGRLMQLEVIRQAAIPHQDHLTGRSYTPLRCVRTVRSVEVLAHHPERKRIEMRLHFDVEGVGDWNKTYMVFLPYDLPWAPT
ncbi:MULTISPECIES: hypothetical protein [unclassified Methylobacterium]|uniref:hypothetical protein n=1 Tax=unclassified Methylobacterium TaxID=2615210 RepID=UPI002269DDF2|nr:MULTISPECIES: hypothetical protein [unclassified Methylobacterium]